MTNLLLQLAYVIYGCYLALNWGQKVCHVTTSNLNEQIPKQSRLLSWIKLEYFSNLLNLDPNLNLFCHKFDI